MTTRRHRLVGRAHRRRAQGVPLTSTAAQHAYATTTVNWADMRAVFEAALVPIREAWAQIRATFTTAYRQIWQAEQATQADYVLAPPPRLRHPRQLLHNGRKPR